MSIASKAGSVAARILIVEDNLVNQKLLTVLLKKRGFDLAFAENGEQAITIAGDLPRRFAVSAKSISRANP